MKNGETIERTARGRARAPARADTATERGNGADTLDKQALLTALRSFRRGVFSVRLPEHLSGLDGRIAETFNEVVALNERLASELERMRHMVGTQGQLGQRASLGDVAGAWAASVDSVNALIGDLALPTSETARVDDESRGCCPQEWTIRYATRYWFFEDSLRHAALGS